MGIISVVAAKRSASPDQQRHPFYYASAAQYVAKALCIVVVRPSVRPVVRCPSINVYFACHDISVLCGGLSIKLATNIYHVSENCQKVFSRSAVKGQGNSKTKMHFTGGGIHLDGAESRLTCLWNKLMIRWSRTSVFPAYRVGRRLWLGQTMIVHTEACFQTVGWTRTYQPYRQDKVKLK